MLATLQQAIEAIKAGDKSAGRVMLADILQADLENETAWLWMSSVVDSDSEKRRCLSRVLEINPDNAAARKGLALLGQEQPPPSTEAEEDEAPPSPPAARNIPLPVPVESAETPSPVAELPVPEAEETVADKDTSDKLELEPLPLPSPAESPKSATTPEPVPEEAAKYAPSDIPELIVDEDDDDEIPVVIPNAFPEEAESGEDQEMTSGDETISTEDEAGAERTFWRSEQGTLVIGGIIVGVLLTCVACLVIGLVFRPVAVRLSPTVDAALGTPTPTITPTPTSTGTPTPTPTFTPTPTVTSSPANTPVVADTPTVTATPTKKATPNPNLRQGVVVDVVAGDVIDISIEGAVLRVKYLSIDTPALNDPARGTEPFGQEALDINRLLVDGKNVTLEKDVTDIDEQGRLLRYVYVGDLFVNEEMVRQSVARVNLVLPDTKYGAILQAVENDARLNNLGVWSLD